MEKQNVVILLYHEIISFSYIFLCVSGVTALHWARASSVSSFIDHTQRRTTVGRASLDEWSARRRELCWKHTSLTTDRYTRCNRRNEPDFGRVFLRSYYTEITQNTYIQSSMVTEILAREVWNIDTYYSLIDYQIHIETGRNMWFL